MEECIIKLVRRIRPSTGNVSTSTRLVEDIGLDSLGILELSSLIEDDFSVVVDAKHLRGVRTVGDIVRLLREVSGGALPEGRP